MMFGGSYFGIRLNKFFFEFVFEFEIFVVFKFMIKWWVFEWYEGERFGDWIIWVGYIKFIIYGINFWEDVFFV